jgi:hypothetical protein
MSQDKPLMAVRSFKFKLERQSTYARARTGFGSHVGSFSRFHRRAKLVRSFDLHNPAVLQRPRLAWARLRRIDRVVHGADTIPRIRDWNYRAADRVIGWFETARVFLN